jgi:uncharacterized protein HemY
MMSQNTTQNQLNRKKKMLPALLLNVVQSLIVDKAQSLAKEHVADAIERNLDEDQKKMLDDVVDMMPDNQFKTFKEFIG